MPDDPLLRLRATCLALPEAHEVEAWGSATFRVRNKLFAMYADAASHHGGGRPAVWIKATTANQSLMVRATPERFFVPPYVGPSGWVGVWLDRRPPWGELAALLRDAWEQTAPKRLVAQHAEAGASATAKPAKKKVATKKAVTKKSTTKKAVTKKAVTKKVATKERATKKRATKKRATKKRATKKPKTR